MNFPPGPRSTLPLGVLLPFLHDPLNFLRRTQRKYGDLASFRLGSQHIYLVSDPEMIGQVLVTDRRRFSKGHTLQAAKRFLGEGLLTSEGELHLRQRRLMQPVFASRRIAEYGDVMVAAAEHHQANWRDGQTVNALDEMLSLTMAIAVKTLFGMDMGIGVGIGTDTETVVAEKARQVAEDLTAINAAERLLMLPPRLIDLALPFARRYHRARRRLDTFLFGLMRERRAANVNHRHDDLLGRLLHAHDEQGGMSEQQLRDEVLTLFLAGHETTANALTWTWFLLSQHADAAAEFTSEVDQVLAGRAPTVADVPRLTYTRAVFAEAMRLYPPSWAIERRVLSEYQLGSYRIRPGSLVVLSPYVVHRHPDHWREPDRFDPSRWRPEESARRQRYAYFPFGAGLRGCIGEEFAWLEATLLLAAIGRRWRLVLAPGAQVKPQPRMLLRPQGGVKMRLQNWKRR